MELLAVDPASGKLLPIDVIRVGDTLRLRVDLGAATVTLSPSEIEIGHVALKNNDTEDHADVGTDNHLNVVTRNRSNFDIREVTTAGAGAVAGPDVTVPDGFGVFIEVDDAAPNNAFIAPVGFTGTAGRRRSVAAGDPLPGTLKVSNLNQIEVRRDGGSDVTVRFLLEI